ncbi:MAG: hypothetical protein SFW65_00165 [Alphaproteobacteria bacterium]|nr:hypothetical protein [Alphaproteobacteria bacterium]
MPRKYGSSSEPTTAAEFADAHVEVAENILNDPAAALAQLKEAFKYDERQSIIGRAAAIAKDVSAPLLRIDFYSFVATHAANDGQKNHAIEAATQALAEAATGRACEHPAPRTIDPEGIARRTLDIFSILDGSFSETFGLRSQLMEIWHAQISTLLAQDEAAGTFKTRAFLGQEIVRRGMTAHNQFTIGVLNGAISRVLGDGLSDASAGAPVKSSSLADADAARARLIAKAWHGAGANPSGQRYQ